MTSSEMIRTKRIEKGLTQQEMADMIGKSLQYYQRFEYGIVSLSNARMKTGLEICAILEIDPFELVFADEKMLSLQQR